MNGQEILDKRRQGVNNRKAPRNIGDIAASVVVQPKTTDAPRVYDDASPAPSRRQRPVSLSDIDTRHHPKVANAVQRAREWAQRKRDGYTDASLILAGPNGVGKTHIARAIWWSIRHTAVDFNGERMPGTEQPAGKFFMANDLINQMGTTRDSETGIVIVTRASAVIGAAPLVVIDDIGAEQSIPFISASEQEAERQARLFKVIDYCYTAQISLIITTNLPIPKFADYIGPRSYDRLSVMAPKLQDGRSFMVDLFTVPSWRQKTAGRTQ